MIFIVFIFLNIKAIDFSFAYIINKPHAFNTTNTANTLASDIRKTFYYSNSYYTSFGLSYTHSILDYSIDPGDSINYTTFKFQTYDFVFELGKEFRNNIISSTIFLGHSSSSYNGVDSSHTRKDDGPSYALNLMLGRLLQKDKEAKFGFIYRRLDQEYKYDFFGLMFLLRYRI